MCGRTCLTLEPNQIRCACKYKTSKPLYNFPTNNKTKEGKDDYLTPEWRPEFNCGRKYTPSYNIAPTDITPVLVSSQHFDDESKQSRTLVPMMWAMIPNWHKGDYRKHGLTTNNCRLDNMLESKLFSGPFRRGQRCVVLCEGFYEWQTTKKVKPSQREVHLMYMQQNSDNIKIYDKATWTPDNVNLMKMAGLFDWWEDENGDKMCSYSIITFESAKIMSWLHYRMPAILETEQQVDDWLDFKRVSDVRAMAALVPATKLQWHRVTNLVNNSRNKSDQCNKPFELQKSALTPSVTTLFANLNKRREEHNKNNNAGEPASSENEADNPAKRPRIGDDENKTKPN